jgi:hypothetical protein
MNKEKLWALLIQQNPWIAVKSHSPESVRRVFDLTWNTAYSTGCRDMAEREHEITDGDMEAAEQEAAAMVAADLEKALAAIFGNQSIQEVYATKKATKKKTDSGGK